VCFEKVAQISVKKLILPKDFLSLSTVYRIFFCQKLILQSLSIFCFAKLNTLSVNHKGGFVIFHSDIF
jgi:hypothetical protein